MQAISLISARILDPKIDFDDEQISLECPSCRSIPELRVSNLVELADSTIYSIQEFKALRTEQ
jgi:hypothetical protein